MEERVDFMSVAQISADNKVCSIQEYLGAEVSDLGRQTDVANNPNVVTFHSFAFDHVYGPQSTQQ